ncbi:MAG: hypothetical protein WB795_06485 [Candidatus Acidiferrales bacterium]
MGENVFSTVIAASLISMLLNVFIVRAIFGWLGQRSPVIRNARSEAACAAG